MTMSEVDVEAAARRLRGVLVDTPLIGGVMLPGFAVPAGLRVKVETLQTGGSLWFRGVAHVFARRRTPDRGFVVRGTFRQVLAAVVAATAQRTAIAAVVVGPVDAAGLAQLDAAGVLAVECVDGMASCDERTAAMCKEHAFVPLPALGDVDHDLGVATLGLELAQQMPADIARVLVAPGALASAVGHGLLAGGRSCAVFGVDAMVVDAERAARLAVATLRGLRACCDPSGIAALERSLVGFDDGETCVVLGE